jgi:hypothetical protein
LARSWRLPRSMWWISPQTFRAAMISRLPPEILGEFVSVEIEEHHCFHVAITSILMHLCFVFDIPWPGLLICSLHPAALQQAQLA